MRRINTLFIFLNHIGIGTLKCLFWILYSPILILDCICVFFICIAWVLHYIGRQANVCIPIDKERPTWNPKRLLTFIAVDKIKSLWKESERQAIALEKTNDRSDQTLLLPYEGRVNDMAEVQTSRDRSH